MAAPAVQAFQTAFQLGPGARLRAGVYLSRPAPGGVNGPRKVIWLGVLLHLLDLNKVGDYKMGPYFTWNQE